MDIFWSVMPFILIIFIFLTWLTVLHFKTYYSFVDKILAAVLIAFFQIVFSSMVFGIIGFYSWEIIYVVNLLPVLYILPVYSTNVFEVMKMFSVNNVRVNFNRVTKILLSLGLIVISWQLFLAIVLNDTSYDSLNYHLPWSAYAVQEGKLRYFPSPIEQINLYPKNLELVYSFFILAPGNDWLIDTLQIGAAILLVLASYSLLRKLDFQHNIAAFCSVLFLFIPIIMQQMSTDYIDIYLAALVMISLNLALNLKNYVLTAFLLGGTIGLMIGASSSMIVPSIAAFVLIVYSWKKELKKNVREIIKISAVVWGSSFILSSYWYLKNLYFYKFYIFDLSGKLTFDVVIPRLIQLSDFIQINQPVSLKSVNLLGNIYANSFLEGVIKYDMAPGGFGPVWVWIMTPLVLPALYIWIAQKSYKKLVLFLVLITMFLIYPDNWWWKNVIFLFFVGVMALSEFIQWSKPNNWGYRFVCIYVLLLSILSISISWWPDAVDWRVIQEKARMGILNRDFSYKYSSIFKKIEKYQNHDTVIAYDSDWQIIYPLWNKVRANRIIYLPYDEYWMEKLLEQQVDYVAIKRNSIEYQFIESNSENFVLLESEDDHLFYNVVNYD